MPLGRRAPAAAILALALVSTGCGERSNASLPTARPLPIRAVHPEPVDSVDLRSRCSGELLPRRRAQLGFRQSERLLRLLVDEGQRVEAGELLAELDRSVHEARLASAQAAASAAQARLAELEAGERPEVRRVADAKVAQWRALAAARRLSAERLSALAEGAHGSKEDADLAARDAEAAEAQLAGALAEWEELENGTRKEVVAAARADWEAATARASELQADLERMRLVAPFAGRVARIAYDEGSLVSAGAPVLELVESDALEAWIGVPRDLAVGLAEAANCRTESEFKLLIDGRPVAAQPLDPLPELDPAARTVTLRWALSREDSRSHFSGQLVSLECTRREPLTGLWIPSTALVRSGEGLWSVYALESTEDGSLQLAQRQVTLLHEAGERILVRGAIDVATQIMAEGTQRAVPGLRVSVFEGSAAPSGLPQ